jgi:hypothetical protein
VSDKPKKLPPGGGFNVRHEAIDLDRTSPVTVTISGYAAAELRRVAKRGNGPMTPAALTALVTASVNRGLPIVEHDMESTVFAALYAPVKYAPRRSKTTNDITEENDEL